MSAKGRVGAYAERQPTRLPEAAYRRELQPEHGEQRHREVQVRDRGEAHVLDGERVGDRAREEVTDPAGDHGIGDRAAAAELRAVLTELAAAATGSSMRIARAIVLAEPPSVGAGEITPKGSLNVRAVTTRRAGLVERLYDDADAATIRSPGPR